MEEAKFVPDLKKTSIVILNLPSNKEQFFPKGILKPKQSFEFFMGNLISDQLDFSTSALVI